MSDEQVAAEAVETPIEEVKEKPSRRVVTSSNFEEYANEMLGVDPEAEALAENERLEAEKAAREAREKEEEDDPTSTLAEHEDHPEIKKKRGRLQERFSELTGQRNEAQEAAKAAQEAAEQARREAEEARRQADELRQKYEKPKEPLGEKPKPEDFTDISQYSQALEDYTAEKTLRDKQEADAQAKAEREQRETIERFTKRQADFMENTPDYQQVINSASDIQVSDEVKAAILDADNGPEILYTLAGDKEFAKSLGEMPVHKALREIGKLEARFSKPVEGEQQPSTPVSEISKAPPPISPLKGASNPVPTLRGSDKLPPNTDYQWYKKQRLAGKIK